MRRRRSLRVAGAACAKQSARPPAPAADRAGETVPRLRQHPVNPRPAPAGNSRRVLLILLARALARAGRRRRGLGLALRRSTRGVQATATVPDLRSNNLQPRPLHRSSSQMGSAVFLRCVTACCLPGRWPGLPENYPQRPAAASTWASDPRQTCTVSAGQTPNCFWCRLPHGRFSMGSQSAATWAPGICTGCRLTISARLTKLSSRSPDFGNC